MEQKGRQRQGEGRGGEEVMKGGRGVRACEKYEVLKSRAHKVASQTLEVTLTKTTYDFCQN